jgi:hypothetical protein
LCCSTWGGTVIRVECLSKSKSKSEGGGNATGQGEERKDEGNRGYARKKGKEEEYEE